MHITHLFGCCARPAVEAQDAWACYFCPNVATAKPKEFIAAGSTSSSYRVAPEYNPWDVQAALDRYFSCSNSYAAVSAAACQDCTLVAAWSKCLQRQGCLHVTCRCMPSCSAVVGQVGPEEVRVCTALCTPFSACPLHQCASTCEKV
jgi:hypothetical protein